MKSRILPLIFLIPKLRKKNVKLMKCASVDAETEFEGNNTIGPRSKLKKSYMGLGSYIAGKSSFENVFIGRFSSIGSRVNVAVGNHPTRKFVSTHPAFYSAKNASPISYVKQNLFEEVQTIEKNGKSYCLEIGNDVWVGDDVTFLAGVKIRDGAIVGAGSIVLHDIPAYTIVAGVPARVIRKRFTEEEIDFLERLKWWERSQKWLHEYAKYFDDIQKLQRLVESEDGK